jgi:hypothetical protein
VLLLREVRVRIPVDYNVRLFKPCLSLVDNSDMPLSNFNVDLQWCSSSVIVPRHFAKSQRYRPLFKNLKNIKYFKYLYPYKTCKNCTDWASSLPASRVCMVLYWYIKIVSIKSPSFSITIFSTGVTSFPDKYRWHVTNWVRLVLVGTVRVTTGLQIR